MRLARRISNILLAALLAGSSLWCAGPAVEFIQITDTHVVDLAEVHPALAKARGHFAKSGAALDHFLTAMAPSLRPAFLLHTGDISDAYCFERASGAPVCRGVEHFAPILRRCPVPVYLALGNHDVQIYRHKDSSPSPASDYSVAARARKEWAAASKNFRKGTYYGFKYRAGKTTYHFLVLDNGERKLAKDSAFSAAQLAWLGRQSAASKKAIVILVMHVPLGNDAYSAEIKSALAGAGRIALSIAGHRHSDGIEEIAAGQRQFPQVRTAAFGYGENNWRRFRLLEDRIEIGAPGKSDAVERTVPVPAGSQR